MHSKDEARLMDHVETAAKWYRNTQSTVERPWGDIRNLSDEGRFVYEVYKGTRWSRAAGVWAQALAIMNLLDVAAKTGETSYEKAALDGVRYLLSLQCLDVRYPECQGAFWEHVPCGAMSWVRDSATACFGLNRLYQYTGRSEYLERARLWADWFMKYGTRKDSCWPYIAFDFKARKAHSRLDVEVPELDAGSETPDEQEAMDGDWQAGCGLALHQLASLSGEDKYAEEGLRPMLEKTVAIYDRYGDDPAQVGWHGETPITYGNDDFALISLIAGFRRWHDERYLRQIKQRTRVHLDWMADDGSYPNFGSTFVCGIEHIEYLKLAEEFGFTDHVDAVKASLKLTTAFGLTLQERTLNDPMYYGGLYGQTSYGVGRDRIHHRSTGYSINYYLKRLPGHWPSSFSAYGWERRS